ncbi:MAG: aminoglycoside phosphotransferase family protein [Kiritimatiellae bacterium]|nr:aminoglycoside phosphotransferase family protein [Kiritimatiellia bacterium]
MGSRNYTPEELSAALASMGVADATDVSRYGSGHINDTFKVETKSGVRYILQRVNTDIFDPVLLKSNITRVTEFLKSKGVKSLEVVGYENPWRLYAFLEGYTSVDVVTDVREAEQVAAAFAKFQNDLADMPPPRLEDIIKRFHDTPDRLRQLDEAVAADVKGRKASVAKELAFVDARRAQCSRIVDLMKSGAIPERVVHQDTKINNVMLAPDGTNVVIDLDTTMPGSALYDFGDMVRTSSAAAAEDEKDLSKVYSKKEYFEALVKGYLAGAKFLNEAEKANIAFSGRLLTLECGIRFLTDYLNGDTYFHTSYAGHNLVRCHTQFKMVESMEEQAAEYEAIVKKYSS